MFKFIKYEVKGTYKYILGTLALVLILITGFYNYAAHADKSSAPGAIFVFMLTLTLFGTALTTFLYIVGSFRKELYEDTGYLTFTLPLTGKAIVGAKLTVALFWFFLLGAVIAGYNLLMISRLNAAAHSLTEILTVLAEVLSFKQVLFMLFTAVLKGLNFLLLIYFSITLSRVTFRNKKIGGLWFILFLILSGLMSYGETKIASLLPHYLDLNRLNINSPNLLTQQINTTLTNGLAFSLHTGVVVANIASYLYVIVITAALFMLTGYLIEKKIDL